MDSPVRKMQKKNDYNRHKLLRKIKRRRKADNEKLSKIAEKELKRRLKVTPPKFEDGKDSYNFYPSAFDANGNLKPELTVTTPDVEVVGKARPFTYPNGYRSAYDRNLVNDVFGTVVDFSPGIGDAKLWVDAGIALNNGNYSEAAFLGALGLLPNVIEKPLKYGSNVFKNFIKNFNDTKHTSDAIQYIPNIDNKSWKINAMLGDLNVGYISGDIRKDGFYVNSSEVDPHFRRRGIGTELYKNANKSALGSNSILKSRKGQHMFTLTDESGRHIAPATKLWNNLVEKGFAKKIPNPPVDIIYEASPNFYDKGKSMVLFPSYFLNNNTE